MSEVVYQIIYYKIHVNRTKNKPVQYMIWYTTSDMHIRLITDWDDETESDIIHTI